MQAATVISPMAKIAVRHLVAKPGKGGSLRRFWEPGGKLRSGGWHTARLADDLVTAIVQAEAINGAVDRWRRGSQTAAGAQHVDCILAAAPAGVVVGHSLAAPPVRPRPTTLAGLIHFYRLSDDFRGLRLSTRKTYEDNLRVLERWGGDAPLEVMTPARFRTLWKTLAKRTPTKAGGVVAMARLLFGWARREVGYKGYRQDGVLVSGNPASKLEIETEKPQRTEEDLWTAEEIAIFSAVAEQMGRLSVGLAVELNAWLGQREGDLLALGWHHYRQGVITVNQSKTKARVHLPVDLIPELSALLDRLRTQARQSALTATTILVNERTGRAWSPHSFHHAFAEVRTKAKDWCPSLAGRQFMLLRHTAIARLAEAGCTTEEISAISGHTLQSVVLILERYHVRTKKMAETAFLKRLRSLRSEDR